MRRAVLYMRVSTVDQHPETQLHDLRQMAAQRGYSRDPRVHRQDQRDQGHYLKFIAIGQKQVLDKP